MLEPRDGRLRQRVDHALLPTEPRRLPRVVANRWQGQVDCLVGPFSSRRVAEHFADRVVDFGQFDAYAQRILASGDAWFVAVLPDPAGG